MENIKQLQITQKILSKETIEQNKSTFELLDKYNKTIKILERTSIILGKKVVYKSTSATTINGNINLNTIGSTH
jgi:hypothetical protein